MSSATHLFDGRAFAVLGVIDQEPLGVLATLARVGLAADAVHGDCQSGVCLVRDAAETPSA